MENNNNIQPQYQQPQYQQQPQFQQPYDPNYEATAKGFLTKAIVSCCIAALPIGSIIAIILASGNRKAVLEYINQGGMHTPKIKVCSCLSRAGKYAGIGYTIFWAFYLCYFLFMIFAIIIGAASNY